MCSLTEFFFLTSIINKKDNLKHIHQHKYRRKNTKNSQGTKKNAGQLVTPSGNELRPSLIFATSTKSNLGFCVEDSPSIFPPRSIASLESSRRSPPAADDDRLGVLFSPYHYLVLCISDVGFRSPKIKIDC